jgi:hypothetical protein
MDQAILDQLSLTYGIINQIKLLLPLYMDYISLFLGIIYGGIMALITTSEMKAMR